MPNPNDKHGNNQQQQGGTQGNASQNPPVQNQPVQQAAHQNIQQPVAQPNAFIPDPIERKPVDLRFQVLLSELMTKLTQKLITPAQAKLQLHAWFNNLEQEEKLVLYRNDTARKAATVVANYGQMFQQEVPALLSNIQL